MSIHLVSGLGEEAITNPGGGGSWLTSRKAEGQIIRDWWSSWEESLTMLVAFHRHLF